MIKTLLIDTPKIFSFKESLWQLDRGFNDCLIHLKKDSVSRLIRISSGLILLSVELINNQLKVTISKDLISQLDIGEVRTYVESWFDLKRDLQDFYFLLDEHPILNQFTSKYWGTRIVRIPDLFESLCWCIIGQQINLHFAHQVKRHLVESYGERLIVDGIIYYSFPTPNTIRNINREEFVQMKFSRQKIDYLYIVSEAFINKSLSKNKLLSIPTLEKKINCLTKIKGVGIWTANYVAMKCLGEMSCITYGDTGLSQALHTHFHTERKPSKDVIDNIFSGFRGWESYLNIYLWRSLE